MAKFNLEARCVDLSQEDVPDLNEMTEKGREIKFSTFARHVDCRTLSDALGYVRGEKLSLGTDYAVSFFKSIWRGKPCYYMVHSAIEFIFTEGEHNFSPGNAWS